MDNPSKSHILVEVSLNIEVGLWSWSILRVTGDICERFLDNRPLKILKASLAVSMCCFGTLLAVLNLQQPYQTSELYPKPYHNPNFSNPKKKVCLELNP